jgi:hypothetical protein
VTSISFSANSLIEADFTQPALGVTWLRAAVGEERGHSVEVGEAEEDGQHDRGVERGDPRCRTGGTLTFDAAERR